MDGEKLTVGWLLEKTGGSIKTGPFGTKLKASEYSSEGVPVISVGEIGSGRITLHKNTPKVDESVWGRMPEFILKAGDIVFGRKGAVERSAQLQHNEEGYFLGSDGIRIRLNEKECDPRFIAYQFQTKENRNWMAQHAAGTTMPSLNEGIIRRIPIVFKPLPVQRRIASILGSLDDKIELNRQMNETLEAMAKALFQSWFVDFDPVHAKAQGKKPEGMNEATADLFPDSFVESELGMIPKGWRGGILKEAFDLTMGQSPPGETYNESGIGIPFYQGTTDFGVRYPTKRVYCTSPTRFANPDDTLVSVRAPVGRINMAPERCCIGRGVAAVQYKSKAPSFTYQLLNSLRSKFENFESEGTVFGAINKISFESLPVIIVPDNLVFLYEFKASPLAKQMCLAESQSKDLCTLRDTLLPKLLSGELSTNSANEQIEEVLHA